MEACFSGHVECAQLLVEHGSSCLDRDFSGFSSLHYAVDGGHIDMVNFVLNEGVPVSTSAQLLAVPVTSCLPCRWMMCIPALCLAGLP